MIILTINSNYEICKIWGHNQYFNRTDGNIFVEMYTSRRDTAKAFSELDQYPKRVCFVPFQTESPYLMELEKHEKHLAFWETVNSNAAGGANALKYNPVDLLCMEKCIRNT